MVGSGADSALKEFDSKLKAVEHSRSKDAGNLGSKIKDLEKKMDSMDVNSKIKTIQVETSFIMIFEKRVFILAFHF